jgi:ribosomal protein L12E/L44/L45/RPP1/RPP2
MDQNEQAAENLYRNLTAVIVSMDNMVNRVVLKTLSSIMSNETMKLHVDALSPYVYAIAFLSYTGRDINADNITTVMKTVGKVPDPLMLDAVLSIKVKSHLIYVYSIYYLIVNGVNVDIKNIADVAATSGMTPDVEAIDEVLQIYKKGNAP